MSALLQPTPQGERELAAVVDEVAHLLPAQGPITVFVHHNTLHAFEQLDFEEAVVRAGELFGCQPFMSEDFYRAELRRGRITQRDLDTTLARALGAAGDESLLGPLTRRELRSRVLAYGVPELRGEALKWTLGETEALERLRDDVPAEVREQVFATRGRGDDVSDDERAVVRELWAACVAGVARLGPSPRRPAPPLRVRHRDLILAACGVDLDDWVDPVLIRFVSAFLDQGLAQWSMSGRERGMYACFLDTFDSALTGLCGPWARQLPSLLAAERRRGSSSLESLAESLAVLGVDEPEWDEFLSATALALRGFAGMVRQLEERPDRVPAHAVPAKLVDFLAVRLLLERSAIAHAAREQLDYHGPLARLRERLREHLGEREPTQPELSPAERAWPLFQLAQLCGLDGAAVASLDGEQLGALERELFELDSLARRELLHLAYERHLRQRFYDAVLQHEPTPTPSKPLFQAIFCLDDREESIRRHLEELEPRCETFGVAGFHGVAMYFRGAEDAHPRPLCPVVITPQHYVAERLLAADSARARLRALRRRGLGLVDKNIHLGSRTMVRGAILMAVLGTLSLIPLVLRVVFPWLENRVAKLGGDSPTRLELDRRPGEPPIGQFIGFTTDEKVAIVRAQLDSIGLHRLAPLVFSLGHGSLSLNNPHASAYDCGACAGGRGGPNGRAFAQMANDPEVRARLAALGRPIPDGTWFVGGYRNSTDSSLTFYDLDRVPEQHRAALEHSLKVFERARRRDAHERCRRFELARLGWSSSAALRHVESRAADLAQPRAECGHATNALCFVGRRARLRGLFLDRRCFLSSYDPSADDDGRILAGVLNAVVPVVAGINLEYYFSYVDPRRYGSGTKLPHNVSSLLGVMDGAQSDLRTGLPWQMVEIHEPVRTSLLVEASPELLARVIAESPTLTRLVEHRWVYLACLDLREGRVWEHGPSGFTEQAAERALATVRGSSRTIYQGKRGHLPFTRILPSEPEVRRS